jgi:hypothetical protein
LVGHIKEGVEILLLDEVRQLFPLLGFGINTCDRIVIKGLNSNSKDLYNLQINLKCFEKETDFFDFIALTFVELYLPVGL